MIFPRETLMSIFITQARRLHPTDNLQFLLPLSRISINWCCPSSLRRRRVLWEWNKLGSNDHHKFFIWRTMTHARRPFRISRDQSDSFFNTHTHTSLSDQKKCIQRTQPEKPTSQQHHRVYEKAIVGTKVALSGPKLQFTPQWKSLCGAAALKIAINYERRPKFSHWLARGCVRASFWRRRVNISRRLIERTARKRPSRRAREVKK